MSNYALLNNIEHQDLKVNTTRSKAFGDNVMSAVTFPGEFREVQGEYPILFTQDKEGQQIVPLAMFGFEKNENLFLGEQGWDAHYIPAMISRLPFLIGFQEQEGQEQPVIHVDLDSPRINSDQGEALFLPQGGHTKYTQSVAQALMTIHQGQQHNKILSEQLQKHDLLVSLAIDIQLKDGAKHRLAGFSVIDEDKLRKLDDRAFLELREKGVLEPLYMAIASLTNLQELIRRKNQASD